MKYKETLTKRQQLEYAALAVDPADTVDGLEKCAQSSFSFGWIYPGHKVLPHPSAPKCKAIQPTALSPACPCTCKDRSRFHAWRIRNIVVAPWSDTPVQPGATRPPSCQLVGTICYGIITLLVVHSHASPPHMLHRTVGFTWPPRKDGGISAIFALLQLQGCTLPWSQTSLKAQGATRHVETCWLQYSSPVYPRVEQHARCSIISVMFCFSAYRCLCWPSHCFNWQIPTLSSQ